MSSRASVRITITNIADDENYNTNNNLDSPGSAISMADRELPKVPTEEGELYLEDDHDYDILDESRLPFSSPKTLSFRFSSPKTLSLRFSSPKTPTAEYDTIEGLVGGGYATIRDPGTPPQPDYATIPRDGGGGGGEDRMYDCLPDAMISTHKRKPSYEALPDMFSPEMFSPIARSKACTFSGSIRPSSEMNPDYHLGELNSPKTLSLRFSSPKTPTAEYDTIEGLVGGGYATIRDPGTPPQPDYATIPRDGGGGGGEDRMYDCLPDAMISTHKRKPSYEALPDMFSPEMFSPIARSKACTFSGSIRPSSEVYAVPIKPIDKHRAGSARKARENEDTVSVIYASINPETRSMNEPPAEEEDTAPPMPENPYAILDNMLSDLNIRPDSRHYDEIANLRPGSGISMDIEGGDPALSSLRRTNPVLANSSPFAVTNNAASVICDVNSDQ
eukprot:sb/3464692/